MAWRKIHGSPESSPSWKRHKANKPYICRKCWKPIEPGQEYARNDNWSKEWCLDCARVWVSNVAAKRLGFDRSTVL